MCLDFLFRPKDAAIAAAAVEEAWGRGEGHSDRRTNKTNMPTRFHRQEGIARTAACLQLDTPEGGADPIPTRVGAPGS